MPIYTAVLATAAIRATNDAALQAELLPKIASGETLVALAFTEAADSWIPVRASVTADGAGAVTGTKSFVRDAQFADYLLVLTDSGLVLVAADAAGVTRTPLGVLDASVFAARVDFSGAAGRAIEVADLEAFLTDVDAVASVLLAASQYGAYKRELEITTQYAKDRFQFGRSIGSFQGVKFPLANWAMEAELALGILRQATSLGAISDSVRFCEHRVLRGKLGAPLGTTSREDATACTRAHAGAEAMLLRAAAGVGLVCALAHEFLRLLCLRD